MDRWKSPARKKLRHGESQKGEDKRWRKSEERRCRCAKRWESRETLAAGAEPARQMRDKKLHAVVVRSTLPSQNAQTPQFRTAFRSCNAEKVHAVLARSTFGSQNVQSTSASDPFWKLQCRKSARSCGAKRVCKSTW